MKVIFSREARDDLRDIGRYLLLQNPTRALTFMEELRSACLDLAGMPEAFEILETTEHIGLRRRIFSPYLIFYKEKGMEIKIVRVIHGARDYLQILDPQI